MNQTIKYLEGKYDVRLLCLRIDVYAEIALVRGEKLSTDQVVELGQKLWKLYAEFNNQTVLEVADFDRTEIVEDEHVEMMTWEYIVWYVDLPVFAEVITAYMKHNQGVT